MSHASAFSARREATRANEGDPSGSRGSDGSKARGPPFKGAGKALPSLLAERLERLAGRQSAVDASPDDRPPPRRDNVVTGGAYPAASLVDFLEQRSRHWANLGRLDAAIAAAEHGCRADVPALRRQLAQWVRSEKQLGAVGAELVFRLYWDDLGGES